MSKVLLINGSPHPSGCTYTALSEVAAALEKRGIETKIYQIGTRPVAGCIACGRCSVTGKCIFDDGVNEIASEIESYAAIVVGSPVYYSGASGQICSFLDRLFYTAGSRMAGKLGAAVVSCRRGGATAAYERLNKYFEISSMHTVGSQYWNQVHGNTPEDVMKDEEGLQTMRTLGENMAWLIKCIEAGDREGIERPVYEKRMVTNFIK